MDSIQIIIKKYRVVIFGIIIVLCLKNANKSNLSTVLELFSFIIAFGCNAIIVKPEEKYKKIVNGVTALPVMYSLFCLFNVDFVYAALEILYNYPAGVVAYIELVAVLPPLLAYIEKKKCEFDADDSYMKWNLIFNLAGTIGPLVMFYIARSVIPDFQVLRDMELEALVCLFVPVCAAFVFLYQREEQQQSEDVRDHDPSIRWINQIINMLHLFNTYLLAIISSIYVIMYTMYCRIHNIQLEIHFYYFVFLQLTLLFFYLLALKPNEYLFFIMLVDVPAILLSSIYWLSWFKLTDSLILGELVFIITNVTLFTVLIMFRDKILIKSDTGPDEGYKKIFKCGRTSIWVRNKSGIYFISAVFVVLAYGFLWLFPMTTQRVAAVEAEKYVREICVDTEFNTEKLIENMRKKEMYDSSNDDYNKNDYMDYINDRFHDELIEKNILEGHKKVLKFEELTEWYDRQVKEQEK